MSRQTTLLLSVLYLLFALVAGSNSLDASPYQSGESPPTKDEAGSETDEPVLPKYVSAKAYYILPETHNNQSGYFSLSEGLDGNIHVGTAAYGENAYLVEFDPRDESQRIVLDTNKVCGVNAKGYAAQAKIHTRNYVGPSGTVYVGSKQGYRLDENDKSEYEGGFVMSYDPRNGKTVNLGMPFKGQGVADVTVDEDRGLSYVVTCEDQHWMLGDLKGGAYRELGSMLTPYAMTLIAADGKACAITSDFQLASYDPETDKVLVRPIKIGGKVWQRENDHSIPTWVLTPDRKRAYLLLLNNASLFEIDLVGDAESVVGVDHGKMVDGKNPDSRCGMDLAPDGSVYSVIRIDNETGFGTGYLHHLNRFDPGTKKMEDLGVLSVANPDYFDWEKKDEEGNLQKFIHGFHRLPDGTLTPMHAHMALKVTRDNTIYITVIYPFTLLKIDAFQIKQEEGAAEEYLEWAETVTRDAELDIQKFTQVAEVIAERHMRGGLMGFPFIQQAIAQDLWGRSGGIVHIGFDRPWKTERTSQEKANDIALVGFESAPEADDLAKLKEFKDRGVYIVGFGPRNLGPLSDIVNLCDAWFDTGLGDDDRVVEFPDGSRAGRGNTAVNAIQGATLIAEVVGALTRHGKMPTIWKGYAYDDGREWGEKYFHKKQFHDDYEVPALEAGVLGRRFLTQIRYPIRRLRGQADSIRKAASTMAKEVAAGQNIYVAWQGHMPPKYIGKYDDASWAKAVELHPFLESQIESYKQTVPDEALVLSLGYHGLDPIESALWKAKKQRVIQLSGDHPNPAWRDRSGLLQDIDLGFAFGDSCVSIDGYPLCLFAPSGIAQVIAYEAIQVEMAKSGQ